MSGSNLLLDTNIVLFLLSGEKTLIPLLEDKQLYISFITQLETLGFKGISHKEEQTIKAFFSECIIVDINPVIKDITIELRKKYSLKLPDCIIVATSLYLNTPLISADSDFKNIEELDLILFE